MKKLFVTLVLLSIIVVGYSQKYAYIDTEYVLNNIPTYDQAQKQLDELSGKWQAEVEEKFKEIEKLYKEYQDNKVIYSDELKKEKENEIIEKEKEAKELQKKYFNRDGELYKKRQELVKPIQDNIHNAVKELAEEGNYAVIFDTAGGASMIYTDPKYDLSDQVLKKLGYKE